MFPGCPPLPSVSLDNMVTITFIKAYWLSQCLELQASIYQQHAAGQCQTRPSSASGSGRRHLFVQQQVFHLPGLVKQDTFPINNKNI